MKTMITLQGRMYAAHRHECPDCGDMCYCYGPSEDELCWHHCEDAEEEPEFEPTEWEED